MAQGRKLSEGEDKPRRERFSVPAADVSTIRWIEAQENLSFSLRAVIHDYIERNGYIDPHTKEVGQLPRRGRPPADAVVTTVEPSVDEPVDVVEVVEKPTEPEQAQSIVVATPPEVPKQIDVGGTEGTSGIAALFSQNRD